jgi:hypothetical protein
MVVGLTTTCAIGDTTNKTDRHDISEILLKVGLNIPNPTKGR